MPIPSFVGSAPRLIGAAGAALVLAACDGGLTDAAPVDPGATLTVDASSATAWALVDLGSPARLVQAADPASSPAWDIAFRTTAVTVNGGTSGPADVVAYCVCQNESATNEQVKTMTPESELADFQAVTRAQIPAAGAAWSAAALDQKKWYRYNITGSDHQVWPTHDVYLVKRGEEVYKVQLTGYYGADGKPRQITFRYAKLAG
ncbi:MAG: HmuY family protein [Gemmatimonadota bacterium]